MSTPGSFKTMPMITALSLLVAFALGGCHSAPGVRPMRAQPTVVSGPQGAAQAAGYRVELEVTNPGSEDISLERFDYVFEVDRVGRFEGRWAALRTLPGGATITMVVPASMPLSADLAQRVNLDDELRWRIDGGIRYQAPGLLGQILFDAGIRRPTESFSGSGTFRLVRPENPADPAGNPDLDEENAPAGTTTDPQGD
ncbi:MAG: hypothetical protein CMJ23_11610 [Phycisphaerae bacterium]|nr:hypothetical protein [Phycisphaerae bacterium]